MIYKSGFRWPPQPSTVIGLGVLAGSVCYFITGDPVWAGTAAAAVKIIVPDNSAPADQMREAIELLAQPVGRLLQAFAQQPPVASGSQGFNPASPGRVQSEK
jgi:hypothetical protein